MQSSAWKACGHPRNLAMVMIPPSIEVHLLVSPTVMMRPLLPGTLPQQMRTNPDQSIDSIPPAPYRRHSSKSLSPTSGQPSR